MAHLTETVPTVRRRYGGQVVEEHAVDLIAAEYRHTTARGVMEGDAPDPQLHSHVVVTSAVREDGRIVAVASRPIFRSARELGAFYRSALAHELAQRGYAIDRGHRQAGPLLRDRRCAARPARRVLRAQPRGRAGGGALPREVGPRARARRAAGAEAGEPQGEGARHPRRPADGSGTRPRRASTSAPSEPTRAARGDRRAAAGACRSRIASRSA